MSRGLVASVALVAAACGDNARGVRDATEDAFEPRDAPAPPDAARDAAIDAAPDAPSGPRGLPDIQFIGEEMVDTVVFDPHQVFLAGACEMEEACIGALGSRKLLRFDTVTTNRGTDHLVIGRVPPAGEDAGPFRWSPCHGHHHVVDYTTYELLDHTGTSVVTGRKQAFCIADTQHDQPGFPSNGYTCGNQGLSRGWADIYGRELPCQWIDVTDIAPGAYKLRVVVNPLRTFEESNYDNNEITIDVAF